MSRPPLTSSSVVAIFAVRAGLRNGTHRTSGPISTRVVRAATALSTVHASWMPSVSSASASRNRRWSAHHTESSPPVSAAIAMLRSVDHRSGPRSRSCWPMGSMRPIFMPAMVERLARRRGTLPGAHHPSTESTSRPMRTKLLAIGLAMAGLASAAVAAVAVWRHMGPERDAAAGRLLPGPGPRCVGAGAGGRRRACPPARRAAPGAACRLPTSSRTRPACSRRSAASTIDSVASCRSSAWRS